VPQERFVPSHRRLRSCRRHSFAPAASSAQSATLPAHFPAQNCMFHCLLLRRAWQNGVSTCVCRGASSPSSSKSNLNSNANNRPRRLREARASTGPVSTVSGEHVRRAACVHDHMHSPPSLSEPWCPALNGLIATRSPRGRAEQRQGQWRAEAVGRSRDHCYQGRGRQGEPPAAANQTHVTYSIFEGGLTIAAPQSDGVEVRKHVTQARAV
jgi:hypothetical protein